MCGSRTVNFATSPRNSVSTSGPSGVGEPVRLAAASRRDRRRAPRQRAANAWPRPGARGPDCDCGCARGSEPLACLHRRGPASAPGAADPSRGAGTCAGRSRSHGQNPRDISKTVDAIQALERLDDPAPGDAADPDGADHDEPPPRSLEELRQELARHLDRLAEEEMLERGFGFDDGEGAGEFSVNAGRCGAATGRSFRVR